MKINDNIENTNTNYVNNDTEQDNKIKSSNDNIKASEEKTQNEINNNNNGNPSDQLQEKKLSKPNDLKSLLEASNKKQNNNQNFNKNLININTNINNNIDLKIESNSKNNQIDDGWEEVKKGGSRMKLANTENSFDISSIGKIFQGILKHDLETKGLSISKCLIEPFFVLSLDLAEFNLDNCFEKFFSRKKVENITNPSASFHQRAFIEKLPKILIIHVKGFYYDKNAHKVVKIMKELDYPFDLKIKKDYFSPSVYHLYKDNDYELISSNINNK